MECQVGCHEYKSATTQTAFTCPVLTPPFISLSPRRQLIVEREYKKLITRAAGAKVTAHKTNTFKTCLEGKTNGQLFGICVESARENRARTCECLSHSMVFTAPQMAT